jgi:hypothetical protein
VNFEKYLHKSINVRQQKENELSQSDLPRVLAAGIRTFPTHVLFVGLLNKDQSDMIDLPRKKKT